MPTPETTQQPMNARQRYGTYTSDDREELAVRIVAADFNGESWDGCPFSVTPEWLKKAVTNGALVPNTRRHTDYADWDVVTADGVKTAEPDDWIVRRESGELSVVDGRDAFVLINLRPPARGDSDAR